MRAVLPAHGDSAHRPNGTDPISATWEIKLYADDEEPATGDGRFTFEIPDDCGGTYLRSVRIYLTTSGSGTTLVQLHNVTAATDMLSTRVSIDTTELSSRTSSSPFVLDQTGTPSANYVSAGDQIRVDIDSVASGSAGLGIGIWFGPNIIYLTP